jgi:YHS domain-containing protein
MTFSSRRFLLVAVAVLALSGCGAMTAQNPSGKYTPVNAVADGDDTRVILKGADVVAYFVDGKYQAGSPQFTSKYEGVTFRFASAEHKALFDKEPGKYLPQFGGYCANGIAYAIPWGGDADTWKIIDGKLYIFGGQASKDAFELDEKKNLALADSYWKDEVAGNNSFIQRSKRLVFRVPHYRSGEELAQAVAQAKGSGK